MPVLNDIIKNTAVVRIEGDVSGEIASLEYDSRRAGPGQLFFALTGTQADGHDFIGGAVGKGAPAVICERLPEKTAENVTYVLVPDAHIALGEIASAFYGNPSAKLKLVGVTGTNGKTTTATLLYDLFRKLGYKAGLFSTVVNRIDEREVEATHTTPDQIELNALLAEMAEAGCDYCFMEVSSHSIVQRRIAGLTFAGGIFTNITHDHLDYHKTFAEYIKAKKAFFDGLSAEAFAVVNIDDRNGAVMVQNTRAAVRTVSLQTFADFRCRIIEMHLDGMLLDIDGEEVWVRLTGRFNACNLLGIYAAAVSLGADKTEALTALSLLAHVNGRFDFVRSEKGTTAIVDYAHTPDALQNVMDTINEIRGEGRKLFVVVGCGGDRDAAKRPVMARIAASESDMAILTSDNPRTEDPRGIIGQMEKGVDPSDRYLSITDRREAIRTAAAMAGPDDIILIAGKGHETYQDANGVKTHFDDKEEIAKAFGSIR